MKRMFTLLLASFALCGCAAVGNVTETVSETVSGVVTDLLDVFSKDHTAYVRESGHSLNCGSTDKQMSVRLFLTKDEAKQWETSRNLSLLKPGGGSYAYALVDMGQQPTGGYGVLVSRKAEMSGDLLTLKATLIQPEQGQVVSLASTNPCALIVLPLGEYKQVEVKDQDGKLIATTAQK